MQLNNIQGVLTVGHKNHYQELMRVSCQWQDLLVRKRFGFSHEMDKVPHEGDLALFCVACPQPRINLPLGREENIDP